MTLRKRYFIACDACDAVFDSEIEADTAPRGEPHSASVFARQAAGRSGWVRVNGKDLCPRHVMAVTKKDPA